MSTRNFLKFIITFCFLTALLYHLGQFDTGLKEVEETEYSEVFKEANLPETFNPTVFNAGFTQNKGQLKDQYGNPNNKVKYISEQAGFNVQLRESGFSYDVVREEGPENEKQWVFHRIDIDFVDAGQATIIEEEATGAIKNFQKSLMGAAGDITGVQTFRKIIYQDLYPKIDLSFEIDSSGQMEYNFIVHEGGDPAAIQLAYKGADELELVDGKLRLGTQFGAMEEVIPKSWYENEGQMEEVEVEYLALEENVISFAAPAGEGDLVIDPVPVVEFKISHKMDRVYDIALDNGYFILTGVTYQNGFASTGAHKTYYGDGLPNSIFPCSADGGDAYLIVLDKTGEKYWATYYGDGGNICLSPRNDGKVFKDLGLAVATDGNGYIYFGGETGSENGIATDNGYDDTWNGFMKRAETEMNTEAEKNFLEGLKLALDLESERVASDKTELEESEAKREEDRQKEQETERKKEKKDQDEKDQDENEASEDQPKKEKDQDENQQVDKGLVVNLDPGDKTIDKAFKDIEKRDTDLETPVRPVTDTTQKENKKYELFKDFKKDQVDFSEAGKDGSILLLAHGMPRYPWLIPSDSSSRYAFRFANMSPNKFADYLINNNLPKDYSGMIYLDGCYTASGNTKKNFALQVYNRLVDQGYNFLQVKGNLGAAVTLNDGTEIVTHAAVEKQAKKLSKEISKLDKNKADLENKINEILRPSKNEENALKLNIVVLKDKLGKAEESGDQIEIGKLEKEIQKVEEQKKYATQIIENLKQDDEYQKTNDELVSLDDTLSI